MTILPRAGLSSTFGTTTATGGGAACMTGAGATGATGFGVLELQAAISDVIATNISELRVNNGGSPNRANSAFYKPAICGPIATIPRPAI